MTRSRIGRWAVSVVALAGVGWWISRQDAPTLPDDAAGFGWLAAALAVYAVVLWLRGWRWHLIMRLSGIEHRRGDAFGLTLVGYMGNTVLPARGGEVMRVAMLGARSPGGPWPVLGSVVAERVLDAAALVVLFVGLTWLGVDAAPAGGAAAWAGVGALAAGALGVVLYVRARRAGRFGRVAKKLRPVSAALRLFARREGAVQGLLSVGIWIVEGVTLLLIARALDLGVGMLDATMITVLAALLAVIPAGPGLAGTYDAGLLIGAHAAGIEGGAAVGLLLLTRFVVFVPVTIVGLVVLLTRYGGIRRAALRPILDR